MATQLVSGSIATGEADARHLDHLETQGIMYDSENTDGLTLNSNMVKALGTHVSEYQKMVDKDGFYAFQEKHRKGAEVAANITQQLAMLFIIYAQAYGKQESTAKRKANSEAKDPATAEDIENVAESANQPDPLRAKIEKNIAESKLARESSGYSEWEKNTPELWQNADGSTKWPPYPGSVPGTEETVTLKPGTTIDRYGYDGGKFVSPSDTPYENRALKPGTNQEPATPDNPGGYHVYTVQEPITVESSKIMPWFGQPGGGTQYLLDQPVKVYLQNGVLVEIKP